jgi:hypothetical protein
MPGSAKGKTSEIVGLNTPFYQSERRDSFNLTVPVQDEVRAI